MRFPPSFIERLRSHFLMSEVVGKRVALKKHGREFQGLCPFHNEKTPSFTVSDEKGFFHCFGCHAHGDAIEFIRRHDRLSYPEAIEHLAREAGIPLPVMSREEIKKIEQEKTQVDVLEAACQWFERQLMSPAGQIARDYVEKRGLRPETIRQFRIGYAPEGKQALHQYLTQAGFPLKLQVEAGLVFVPEGGGSPYDRFRGRVIFAIRNASGKVIAFGGRLMGAHTNKSLPKYLNSPETMLFKKGEMLFNLDLAKTPARKDNIVVVMEGYMDVVSTAQAGIAYAVATLGTAVTPEHLRLLWQLAKEPVICLDGDAAGMRAMMRAAEIALPLLKPGYSLRFVTLPKGEDPDTYVQKHGKASFEKLLHSSRRLSQVLWETLLPQYKLNLPEGRAALEDMCKKLANQIGDATVKNHYLSYFRKQLWDKTSSSAKPVQERSPLIEQMVVSHHSATLDALAQRLLKVLLKFPVLLHKSQVEETLSRLDITNHRLDALRNSLMSAIAHANLDAPEEFLRYMHEQLPDGWIGALIDAPLDGAGHSLANIKDAERLWEGTLTTYEISYLQHEVKLLEHSMATQLDEAACTRMSELQNALEKAHARRTFAPAESDTI